MEVSRKFRALPLMFAALLLVCSTIVGSSAMAALSSPSLHNHGGVTAPASYYDATLDHSGNQPLDTAVSLGDNFFSPQFITITQGTTVVWTNNGVRAHTVTSDPASADVFNSGNMVSGAVFTHTFTLVGTFGYHCAYHGGAGVGMYGTVTVLPSGGPTNTPTLTTTPTPNPGNHVVGSVVLGQDLGMSSSSGFGSTNSTINGLPFGTGGYVLLNYNGGPSFVPCPCPPSPNSNDYTLLSAPFTTVSISITRGSGLSNPITQTQTGGSLFIDSGSHRFSGLYDAGPNGNNQTLIIDLSNLPTTPFRLTIYNNNNPGNGGRSGTMTVTNGAGSSSQLVNYNGGDGSVTQWLLSGSSTAEIVETNASSSGNLPVGGIMFDDGDGSGATFTPTSTPPTTNTPTHTATPTRTNTPISTSTATSTPLPSSTPSATNTPNPSTTPLPTSTATTIATATSTSVATSTPTQVAATSTPAPATSTPVITNTGTPVITATNTPAPTSTDCPNVFVDLNGNVFYGAIHYLACRSVVNGTDATHYSPSGTSTRGQFAKVVVLGFGLPLSTPAAPDFTDVPTTYFAYVYIETGFHEGVLSGFDQNSCIAHGATFPCYLPNLAITRGQLTKLVVNAGHYSLYTPTTPDFSDVPPSNVFYASIETAHHNSVVGGYPDHTFRPNNNIRRDEMAQIVFAGIIHMP